LGNVWGTVEGNGAPHVVVSAHADQIGLIVTYVDEHGYVSFDKIGGVDAQLLPGRNLIVHGARGPVNGVVGRKPTHKMTAEDRAKAPELSDQWLDLGCSTRDEALELVQIGDPITFPAHFLPLAGGRFASPALDNRAGVYVCLRALEHYAGSPAAADLTALLTVHEETTFMGAKSMALKWRPDVIMVVDVDFASDDPSMDAKKLGGEVKLGAGPVIHRGAGGNLALTDLAIAVAKDEGIPVQIKAMPGNTSTDAEELMAAGNAATLSFSIPVRNMHSAFEVAQPDDAEAGALLAAAITRRLAEDGWDPQRFVPRA
jgi:endoglucanase